MRLIDADAMTSKIQKQYCEDCDRRKGENNGKRYMVYEIGDAPCRACSIDDMYAELDDAPTIHPEPHWIPVTERLPEEGIPVNVTWVNRKPEFYYSEIKDEPYTATAIYFRGRWFWYSCVIEDWLAEYGSNESFLANLQEAVDRDIEITAWCELPEPYNEASDGND